MERLISKSELVIALKTPKTTLTRWIHYFSIFIPIKKQGDVIYYGPEALNVLRTIKKLRQQEYSRPTIMKMLIEQGFPQFSDQIEKSTMVQLKVWEDQEEQPDTRRTIEKLRELLDELSEIIQELDKNYS